MIRKVEILRIAIVLVFGPFTFAAFGQSLDDAFAMRYEQPDSSIAICQKVIGQWDGNWADLGKAHHIIGLCRWIKGEYPDAIKSYNEALSIRKEHGDSIAYAGSLNGLGLVYWKMRLHNQAMAAYLHSLSISEREGDSLLMAKTLGNIGILLEEQDNLDRALEFHTRSLAIAERLKDENTMANGYNNIGIIYRRLKKYDKAIQYLEKSLNSEFTRNNDYGRALSLSNLGFVYMSQNLFGMADKYFNESLVLYEKLQDPTGLAMVYGNLALNALNFNRPKEAIPLALKSMEYARQEGNLNYQLNASRALVKAYSQTGDLKPVGRFVDLFFTLSDSVNQAEARGQVALMQQQYDSQREQIKIELERDRERTLAQAELDRQVLIRNGIFGLGLMALVMLGLQYRNFLRKKRDNQLLSDKNEEILRQKQEITDSIIYAKRLQDARLPHESLLKKLFSEHYIFYRPKDIVSGDFYWAESVGKRTFLAVADCTGHGVPGAMVSMVATEGLNEAVLKRKLTSPSEILSFLNQHIHTAFHTESSEVKDGLDIALVVLENNGSTLRFAGANNSLLIVSTREHIENAILRESMDGRHLHEIKGDRRSIGGWPAEAEFRETVHELDPHYYLALATDGYADQFGGEKGKKMGSARLRKLIPEAALSQAPSLLETTFDRWKISEEQVDDVTVVLVRP